MVGTVKDLAKVLGVGKSTADKMVKNPRYKRAILHLGIRKRMYDTDMFIELSRGE